MATDIHDYLQRHETKSLLRFITCGSVCSHKAGARSGRRRKCCASASATTRPSTEA